MQNILNELTECLKDDERLVVDGRLVKNKIVELALAMDESLIRLLLKNETIKKHFFRAVDGVLVFDKVEFQKFVSNKQFLPDSYTAFKNKIGLTANGEYLTESKEVVLAWPYKDCVLEGGQTKEDQKRKEIFWNETLAPDEIDRLLSPKVLTNFKKYDKDGEHPVERISLEDNLIIKGNNLLALESLKKVYAGKVKLIYIDPPYNRGGIGDTFAYNNSFKHSTWLTFMKNRIEIAKSLLSKDGAMVIAIDSTEQPYLGVLIDELFPGYEKHCITIIHNPGGNQGKNFSYTHEYAYFIFPEGSTTIGLQNREDNPDIRPLRDVSTGNHLRTDAKNCFYPILIKDEEIIGFGEVCDDYFHPETPNIEKENGVIEVYPIDPQGNERKWVFARQSVESIVDELRVEFNKRRKIYDIKRYKTKFNYKTVWFDKKYDSNQHGAKLLKKLVPDNGFTFPKSLYNVKECINAVVGSDKNAVILDYHAGSGTTGHAVLDLNKDDGGNRKFILIEQMDYVESVTSKRIQNVIKDNNKGDSFVNLELKKFNQKYISDIFKCTESSGLIKIWQQIQKTGCISYRINPKSINENKSEFEELSLDEQKRFLIELLDKNQLYVNYSEIDDKDFAVSDEDKRLNKEFYKSK